MKHSVHFPLLQDIGLNEAESVIFEVLLEEGPQKGSAIAQKTEIARGNVYNALATLKEKGLVHEQGDSKITLYAASDPERLRSLIEQKKASVHALQSQFDAIAPQLKSYFKLFTKQPTIRVFEGVEGLKDIYREIVKAKQPVYALVSADIPDPKLMRWLRSVYRDKRVAAGITVKGVTSTSRLGTELLSSANSELREARSIDPNMYPLRGDVNVFGDNVAFIAYRTDELFGLIIESPSLAMSLRSAILALYDSAHAARRSDEAGGTSNTTTRDPG